MLREMYCSIIIDPSLSLPLYRPLLFSLNCYFYSILVTIFIYNKFVDISYRSNWKKAAGIDVKKNIIALCHIGISQHEIAHRLKISCLFINQIFRKFDRFCAVARKSSAGRPPKPADREKRLIKLQQLRGDTASLADLLRYVNTNLNLSIGRSTISSIP